MIIFRSKKVASGRFVEIVLVEPGRPWWTPWRKSTETVLARMTARSGETPLEYSPPFPIAVEGMYLTFHLTVIG